MAITVSPFAEYVILVGAIVGGASAIAMAVALVVGGIMFQRGKDVDPWDLATRKAAPLGACFGMVIALVELVPWS